MGKLTKNKAPSRAKAVTTATLTKPLSSSLKPGILSSKGNKKLIVAALSKSAVKEPLSTTPTTTTTTTTTTPLLNGQCVQNKMEKAKKMSQEKVKKEKKLSLQQQQLEEEEEEEEAAATADKIGALVAPRTQQTKKLSPVNEKEEKEEKKDEENEEEDEEDEDEEDDESLKAAAEYWATHSKERTWTVPRICGPLDYSPSQLLPNSHINKKKRKIAVQMSVQNKSRLILHRHYVWLRRSEDLHHRQHQHMVTDDSYLKTVDFLSRLF